jgi:hypothetical protein
MAFDVLPSYELSVATGVYQLRMLLACASVSCDPPEVTTTAAVPHYECLRFWGRVGDDATDPQSFPA